MDTSVETTGHDGARSAAHAEGAADNEPKLEDETRLRTVRSVGAVLSAYIHNVLPANLIYVPDMKMMGRGAIQKHIQGIITQRVKDDAAITDFAQVESIVAKTLAYAILSHRWLDDGEPTFREMSKEARRRELFATGGVGFHKMMKFCMAARQYGCDWAWTDTCCIDKSSSTELDEAIRSMFRWYRSAKVCIVYLADSREMDDLVDDAWFTRGWTLQELLAPQRVKFFNKDWKPLTDASNDKDPEHGLLDLLSDITEIPINDLSFFEPGTYDIRQKMCWASQRQTTRLEDTAYSLIGIFDVPLMTAYGEGIRAFYRLQMAIMERSNSMDLLMWYGMHAPKDNSMIATSPLCFSSISPPQEEDLPAFVWVKNGDNWVSFGLKNILSYGGTSFMMTNTGLRLDLVLYDVYADPDFIDRMTMYTMAEMGSIWDGDRDKLMTACMEWHPGEFDTDGIRWRTTTHRLGDIRLLCDSDAMSMARKATLRRFSLGILDYEWGDAYERPDSWKQALPQRIGSSSRELPAGAITGDIGSVLQRAREERVYTAILLQEPERHSGEIRQFTKAWMSPYVRQIKRPKCGWKSPETVYIL